MIAAEASTAVETPTASVEAATASVKTSTTTASVTPVLGKSRRRHTDEKNRRDSCEKSFQQGGFPHCNLLPPDGGWLPEEGVPLLLILIYLDSDSRGEVARVGSGRQAPDVTGLLQ